MCVVSMVTEQFSKIWPDTFLPWIVDPIPNVTPNWQWLQVLPQFTAEEITKIREVLKLVEQAKLVDMLAKQPDCVDPNKAEWIKALEQRLADLEKENELMKKVQELQDENDELKADLANRE